MFEIHSKVKRQVEIIGLCLSKAGCNLSTFDLAATYGVEELTIKRDLQELRGYGIDLHSHKHKGINITSEISKEKICECIAYYTGIINPSTLSEKATNLLVEKRGIKALQIITLLQRSIEECTIVRVVYNKMGTETTVKEVKPVMIYQDEGNWRLLAKECDKIKQLLIYKIEDVVLTKEKFDKIPVSEYEDLFRYSWKSWIGGETYKVKLQLSEHWAEMLSAKIFIADQKLYPAGDGTYYFEATVNSLNEITTWIVSLGEGVKVLTPEVLKEKVISLAKGVLGNYP